MKRLAFAALFAAFSAQATSFVNRPISVAVADSANIVRGDSGSSWYNYGPDHKRIYTYTKFTVSDVLKGGLHAGDNITLRSPGGVMDGMEMNVPGVAQFSVGEDDVVLLGEHNADDDSYDIPGFTTGKYNVVKGDTGQPELVNSLGGGAIYDPNKGSKVLSYNSRIPLEVFRHVARGEDVPEAAHNQFQESAAEPPANAFEAGHHHPEIRAAGSKPPVAPVPGSEIHVSKQRALPDGPGFWVPVSFLLLAVAGGVLAWFTRD